MKIIFFAGIILLSLFVTNRGLEADETVTSPGKALTVEEFTGTDDAYLEPTMFPNFYRDASDKPSCADYLMKGDTDPKPDRNNGTGKDRWASTLVNCGSYCGGRSPYRVSGNAFKDCDVEVDGRCNYSNSNKACSGSTCRDIYEPRKESAAGWNADGSPIEASTERLEKGEYQGIPGLRGTVKPAEGYRNITKILFTWTVRLEGHSRTLAVWPFICHPHHGTSYQEFPPGPLKTRLYVKSEASDNGVKDADTGSYVEDVFVPVGQVAEMTVPSAGKGKISNPGDPTITGSYALLPSDFAKGKIPPEVYFEVRWYNETSMRIRSPGKQRNLIATVFPVTNQRSEE